MNKLINKILKESIDVGEVLFGEDKKIASLQGKKYEKDTSIESEIFSDINNFIKNGKKENLRTHFNDLQNLKSKFPRILQPEDNTVFRGSSMSIDKLIELIKKYGYSNHDRYYSINQTMKYTPKSIPTSWSYDFRIAKKFSERGHVHDYIDVIYLTDIDDSFVFNDMFVNILNVKNKQQKEYETISDKKSFNVTVLFSSNLIKYIENEIN